MSVEPGASLLHYTLTEKIGEGGMGAVWRATDTTLNRDVAIKILPRAFAEDQDRLARFEREAKTLAALNHPNIAAVYGLHQTGDTRFLAMELVEGEDLQQMLERGPLPADQAIDIAIQIAAGVDAAHEKGVVHRDLKPANVVRARDGSVKVLDFGLAKSFGDSGSSSDLATSPTITSMGTVAGVILGTASYMSPEQARGQVVDQRTDVWAFGCVLYELLSGKSPFGGDTLTDVLASIVRAEPDWDALRGKAPAGVVTVLRRCLRKNPRERLRSVGDVGLTLKELAEGPAEPAISRATTTTPVVGDRGGPSMRLFAGVLFAVAALAAGLGYWLSLTEPAADAPRRFSIRIPEGSFLPAGIGTILAVSPDGSAIAFVAEDSEHRRLYLRRINDFDLQPLPGTEGATGPFFSPDGEWLAFGTGDGLSKISLSSLDTYPICKDDCGWGDWGDDGNVYFIRENRIWRIPATGGRDEPVLEPIPELGISEIVRPTILPGSNVLLFEIGYVRFGGVGVASLETGEVLKITDNGADPFWSATGHIVFGRESTLFAVPFDKDRFEITGRETHVLQGVRVENAGAVQAAVSRTGMLVHAPSASTMGTQLCWVDREGNEDLVSEQWKSFTYPKISPQGDRIAVIVNDRGRTDVWLVDAGTGGMAPLTTIGTADAPVWTPDGERVVFAEGDAPPFAIRSLAVDGGGPAETLLESDFAIQPEAWSPDGNLLVYSETRATEILFLLEASTGTTRPLFADGPKRGGAAVSPDGRWISYVSNKTGIDEVYVTAFPEPGSERIVSTGSGGGPLWNLDGSGLTYRDERQFHFVSLNGLRAGERERFLDAYHYWGADNRAHFDLHPDGERLVVLRKNEELLEPGINVVLDWFEELEAAAPAER
ncbi:MAG: protein kinase [Acidobacteria bacterium]|nr:protein kinase [Acidobacteriota bacterium]NIM60399.1 protein kinase [Acidobacteriota bacterium]NIO58574.1 protein kinase [Acidobacteriota bacterium]NIQ29626.1 protein kinase [Acidobacteriota bacterium]NIQ84343.1 protein kinase [Acidobacteriota bacterium]